MSYCNKDKKMTTPLEHKVTKREKCTHCDGHGYTAEHDIPEHHNPYTGECLTCPIQVQCDECHATGEVIKEDL
jgi:RecJ-like exonuclease